MRKEHARLLGIGNDIDHVIVCNKLACKTVE